MKYTPNDNDLTTARKQSILLSRHAPCLIRRRWTEAQSLLPDAMQKSVRGPAILKFITLRCNLFAQGLLYSRCAR